MNKLKNVYVLTVCALLVAIATVLGFFKLVVVPELIEIRFAFMPIGMSGMLFGPLVGGIVGALADVLGYLVKPTGPFFPGFTIATAISGVIYGVFLYRKKVTIPRIMLAQAVESVVVSLLLNSLNLSILYGNGFLAVLTPKIVKAIALYPFKTALLYLVLVAVPRIVPQQMKEAFARQ